MSFFNFCICLFALLGMAASADKWVSYRHKAKWHDYAVRYWLRLDDTPVPDILRVSSRWLGKLINKALANKWKCFLLYLIISSFVISFLGCYISYVLVGTWDTGEAGDIFDEMPFPHVLVLAIVILFDLITLVLIRRLLTRLEISSTPKAIIGILSHIVILVALLILCLATIRHVENWLINNNVIGERGAQKAKAELDKDYFYNYVISNRQEHPYQISPIIRQQLAGLYHSTFQSQKIAVVYSHSDNTLMYDIYQSANSFIWLMNGYQINWVEYKTTYFANQKGVGFSWQHDDSSRIIIVEYLMVATLIVPAIIVSISLLFIIASKFIMILIRPIAMYYCELLTQNKPHEIIPFTLIASAADIVLIILKLLADGFHTIYPT